MRKEKRHNNHLPHGHVWITNKQRQALWAPVSLQTASSIFFKLHFLNAVLGSWHFKALVKETSAISLSNLHSSPLTRSWVNIACIPNPVEVQNFRWNKKEKERKKKKNPRMCTLVYSWWCTLYIPDSLIREFAVPHLNYQASCFESEKQIFLLKKRRERKTDANGICWEAAKHLTTQMNLSDYVRRNLHIYITTHSGSYGDLNSHQKNWQTEKTVESGAWGIQVSGFQPEHNTL